MDDTESMQNYYGSLCTEMSMMAPTEYSSFPWIPSTA